MENLYKQISETEAQKAVEKYNLGSLNKQDLIYLDQFFKSSSTISVILYEFSPHKGLFDKPYKTTLLSAFDEIENQEYKCICFERNNSNQEWQLICVYKLQDDWYILTIEYESKSIIYFYICDQLEGVLDAIYNNSTSPEKSISEMKYLMTYESKKKSGFTKVSMEESEKKESEYGVVNLSQEDLDEIGFLLHGKLRKIHPSKLITSFLVPGESEYFLNNWLLTDWTHIPESVIRCNIEITHKGFINDIHIQKLQDDWYILNFIKTNNKSKSTDIRCFICDELEGFLDCFAAILNDIKISPGSFLI